MSQIRQQSSGVSHDRAFKGEGEVANEVDEFLCSFDAPLRDHVDNRPT